MSEHNADLIALDSVNIPEILKSADAVKPVLAQIQAYVSAEAPDTSTAKGRDAIKSLAYKVSRTKTFLSGKAKEMSDEIKALAKGHDEARKHIETELDTLRDSVRKPLTDWEDKEERRKARIKEIFENLEASHVQPIDTSEAIAGAIEALDGGKLAEINAIAPEASDEAQRVYLRTHDRLTALRDAAAQREADARELEELRAMKAEKERLEREAKEKAEAEERQKKEAEEYKARQAQREEERKSAEAKAKVEAEALAERKIAEAKAQAEREKQEAIDAERRRIEKEAADKKAEEERRAANQRVRNAAGKAIMASLIAHIEGLSEEHARAIATAMLDQKIDRVKVEF